MRPQMKGALRLQPESPEQKEEHLVVRTGS
jgi:hypothetical protein